MAIEKPSLNNFLPNGFETQDKDGYKVNFDSDKIATGFDKDTLEILSGPNLNNLLDKTGKNFNTLEQFLTFFRDMPIGSFPITNASNQLDYKSVNSFFRNVGELVFSAIPLEDGNLRLLDGSLLEYTMTYSRFITYIAGLRASLPNLFCTQAEFDQSVATYGVCGKFVYDTVTKSLRLPKISGFIKGTLDSGSLGDVDEAKAPQHSHEVTLNSAGAHKHGRGDMNITGTLKTGGGAPLESGTGAFTVGSPNSSYAQNWYGSPSGTANFDASRSWVGQTSENGSHTHNINIGNADNNTFKVGTVNEPQAIKEFIYIVVSIDEAEKQVLSAVYNYKGSVENYSDLPTAVAIGEVYNVIGEDPEGYSGANFAWTGEEWDRLGGTVNLSGYLTKTEAKNTYATKASLESNVDYLQGQINTNASNIANIASQEVIDAGIRKIEMLKFASTLGMGKVTDTDLFEVIKKYKYSSFDRSKFTVVGSPNITDDGIASGFSSDNYLTVSTNITLDKNSYFKIPFRFKTPSSWTKNGRFLGRSYSFYFGHRSGGQISGAFLNAVITITAVMDTNTWYDAIFINDASGFYVKYKKDSDNTYTTTTPSVVSSDDTMALSGAIGNQSGSTDAYFTGSIDLKQFSITVDGVEVFSGNKTGIDTIKPDNYTVVGTPTISADGVASGFSSSSYISLPNVLSQFNSFKIIAKIKTSTRGLGSSPIVSWKLANNTIVNLYVNTNGYLNCALSEFYVDDGGSAFQLSEHTEYFIKLEYDSNNNLTIGYSTDGLTYSTLSRLYSSTVNCNTVLRMGYSYNNTEFMRSGGSIDLNSFKIYVDGNLVYQPCLKIPYTESKTGLKITDKLDRVIDMSEQCGFSQYFGLDEQNGLCLVPQGDNITGRRDLISRVEDSTTHYVTEIYSDLYCRQMGSGTATTAVTLDIPYKDANYKLSVPQSAKSKTGFTPTATCDWTAEGYIYLDEVI